MKTITYLVAAVAAFLAVDALLVFIVMHPAVLAALVFYEIAAIAVAYGAAFVYICGVVYQRLHR